MSSLPDAPTVIVVEDEPDILLVLRIWLVSEGYRVLEAQTGREALSLLAGQGADVMLLDLRLGDMDGWTLLDRMEEAGLRSLPVIIASAHAGGSTSRQAAERGCGYISKPFSPETVLRSVHGRLALRGLSGSNSRR
jgi:CheY-like chemotaxis protein